MNCKINKLKMKKIILFIAAISIISCQQKAPVDYVLVSGSILNKSADEVVISNDKGTDVTHCLCGKKCMVPWFMGSIHDSKTIYKGCSGCW